MRNILNMPPCVECVHNKRKSVGWIIDSAFCARAKNMSQYYYRFGLEQHFKTAHTEDFGFGAALRRIEYLCIHLFSWAYDNWIDRKNKYFLRWQVFSRRNRSNQLAFLLGNSHIEPKFSSKRSKSPFCWNKILVVAFFMEIRPIKRGKIF